MAVLRLFASVRVAAGTGSLTLPGETVGEVLAAADERFGDGFASLAGTCRVWLNGESTAAAVAVTDGDEVALLPPVSGG
jgi:molybdopterin converting factor small subunit|tara:strand:- start:242 stop:478 length:237 start_codon:yes stop_codon:yes gene_type:complete